jgi:hypothetical protein
MNDTQYDDLSALRYQIIEAGVSLPIPGQGDTAERHRKLLDWGRRDLSAGRLFEAHTDAIAILHQAGHVPRAGALYGVWAANRPGARLDVQIKGKGDHDVVISGSKAFCTGVTLCDAALVTGIVANSEDIVLLDLDVRALRESGVITTSCDDWSTPAFAATATGTIHLSCAEVRIAAANLVGPPGWYLDRPGFWHGAIGPAAVWAGGAIGLIDRAFQRQSNEPYQQAQFGALAALAWHFHAVLDSAGREIDCDPEDHHHQALTRALSVRHLIERSATEVLDRFGQATGPNLLAFDGNVARRHAELSLYIRQCHGNKDLALLYRHLLFAPRGAC